MNEGTAVINEGINLTKQKQARDQLKIQLSDLFFFPCTANASPAAPSQRDSELSSALKTDLKLCLSLWWLLASLCVIIFMMNEELFSFKKKKITPLDTLMVG